MKIIMIYGSWNIRCNRQKFSTFWAIFFALSAPWQTGKSKFQHWKKTSGDIITFHICTINDNHMMYGSWDMEYNRHNFLPFWTIFCPFTPLWTQKIKIFKTLGNKWQSYDVWFLRYGVQQTEFFCHFGLFLSLLPP